MILVTGATGFLGKRICRYLMERNLTFTRTSLSLGTDLRDSQATLSLFERVKPTQVINCAAYVGGIQFGYKHSAKLFRNNLLMTVNILDTAANTGVKRIVNPISNCAYPADARLFKESKFWDGPLHESVLVYGHVRKLSWVGAWAYYKEYELDVINFIFSNMYGPEDHFEEERSHALGALIMKMVRAKQNNLPEVIIWGTGRPVREWLHVDDAVEAMVRGLSVPSRLDPINIGVSKGISIFDMALLIKESVGYKGRLVIDPSKPDGAPFKTVDGSNGADFLGWQPSRSLSQGIKDTVNWYLLNGNH